VQSKYTTFAESVQSTAQGFRAEVAQARDLHDSVCQRVAQVEVRAGAAEEALRGAAGALQALERGAADGIGRAQQAIGAQVAAAAAQLAGELRAEGDERERAGADLHVRTEDVNARAAQNVAALQGAVAELAGGFSQALAALAASARDALEAMRDDADTRARELSARYDELVASLDANFGSLQSESVATVALLGEHAAKAREELEGTLARECEARKRNELEIVRRYDNFKQIIVSEMQLQTEQMDALADAARRKIADKAAAAIAPTRREVAAVRDKTRGAEEIPKRVAEIENQIALLNQQLIEGIGTVGRESAIITGKIERFRADAELTMDQLRERLRIVEDDADKGEMATRTEANEKFAALESEFEGRMEEIQKQIGLIFTNLSELTMSMQQNPVTHEPGADALQRLVKGNG
jgi:hypothetical protein